MRRPEPLLLALLVVTTGTQAAAAAGRSAWPSIRYAAVLAHGDSLARARPRSLAYLDSLIAAARAQGNPNLDMVASLHRAGSRAFVDAAFDEARDEANRWLPRARAIGDTLSWCTGLRTVGFTHLVQQRWAESGVAYRLMLRLARRARLTTMEGYANIGASFLALQAGNIVAAEQGYRAALRQLAGADAIALRTARAGLANSLFMEMKPDESRREYERVLAESRAAGDRRNELDTLNDLGELEFHFGDPSLAEAYFRAATAGHRELRRTTYVWRSQRNLGLTLAAIGRDEEACAIFDSVATGARAAGNNEMTAALLGDIANARLRQGRLAEAEAAVRRGMALHDSIGVEPWAQDVVILAAVLRERGRCDEERRLVRDALATHGDVLPLVNRAELLYRLGTSELTCGKPATAIASLREASALHRGISGAVGASRVDDEAALARAFLAEGARDSALTHFRLAAATWERSRAAPSDPVWRAAIAGSAARVYGEYAKVLLDPARGGTAASRAVDAFAALQPFRARALEDALRGAEGRSVLPRVTLARLQHEVLRPGEVLVDCFVAPETTFVFAVTRHAVSVSGAPGSTKLLPRLGRFRDLLATRESDARLVAASAGALGSDLFGPLAAVLRANPTVLLSAGRLGELPIGMLRIPGEDEPLAVVHEVALIPSATLLAASRTASSAPAARSGVLAISRTTDAEGRHLSGVARETRWIGHEIPGAVVRENDGHRTLDDMLHALGRREVLHVASHTRAPAAAPWRAGFLLGRGAGEDAYLTATRISRLKSPARVCVLASCTSAGTTTDAESIPNLAAAWLAAGASAVIATGWAQDDEATAGFMRRFYSQVRLGRPVGAALRETQRATRAGRGLDSAHAWAGFVVIGDPATRVVLVPDRPRPASPRPASAAR